MFARVLYLDNTMALEMDWMGAGALVARSRMGPKRRALPGQKAFFLDTCSVFASLGEPVSPANPRFSALAKACCDALLYEDEMRWIMWFNRGPEYVARFYATHTA